MEAVEELKVLLEANKLEEEIAKICNGPEEEIRNWMRKMVPNYKNN